MYDDGLSDDEQCDYSDVLTGAKSSVVPVAKSSVTTCNTKELVKPSSTITKESDHHDHGTNNYNTAISTPLLPSASSVSDKPKATNSLSNLHDLFGQGSVLNNCTFQYKF